MNPDKVIMASGGSLSPESLRRLEEHLDSIGNKQHEVLVLEALPKDQETTITLPSGVRIDIIPINDPEG